MARSRSSRGDSPRSSRKTRTPEKASVLERLAPAEAQAVLHRLLAAHPNLATEADQIARGLLGEVRFQSVADDVESAIRALDLDDLGSRAGRHRGGYTSPTEGAWALLQEIVDPFLSDMKRQLELGLVVQALEICKGVLLGLYRIRRVKGDEFLGWAEDFPMETAADVVSTWAGRQDRKNAKSTSRRERRVFPKEFVADHVPEWDDLVARALDRT